MEIKWQLAFLRVEGKGVCDNSNYNHMGAEKSSIIFVVCVTGPKTLGEMAIIKNLDKKLKDCSRKPDS
jgi:uncharacterized protein VirK/YbjX